MSSHIKCHEMNYNINTYHNNLHLEMWYRESWISGYMDTQAFLAKGQLISECLFEKIVWTKIPTKNLIDSAQQRLLPQG